MTRHPIRGAVWFVVTAAGVYGVAVLVVAGLAMANGEGLSCRDAECGAISNWLNGAYPVPMIVAIAVAVIAGVMVARRHARKLSARRRTGSPQAGRHRGIAGGAATRTPTSPLRRLKPP